MAKSDIIRLDDLIAQHRKAYRAFKAICGQHDLAEQFDMVPAECTRIEAEYQRLDRAETAAALAVLDYRPRVVGRKLDAGVLHHRVQRRSGNCSTARTISWTCS